MAITLEERAMVAFEHRTAVRVPVFYSGFSSWAGSVILSREAYVGGDIQQ